MVTGAFGFTGRYITRKLLSTGRRVVTLTGHPHRPDRFEGRVQAFPFNFSDRSGLVDSLAGATTLYNTYWIRFPHKQVNFDIAASNTERLVTAAREAGVQRLVHVSITNPSEDSELPYFRGKALVENLIKSSGISYAIIRPTLIFGTQDILLNNIAWFLRKFPLFPVGGTGEYRVQPVYVDDLATMMVAAGQDCTNRVFDAVGPETYTYEQLVSLIAKSTGSKAKLVHVPAALAMGMAKLAKLLIKDVVLTKDEILGLMQGLLVSENPATASTLFSQWLAENHTSVGVSYTSELERHYR